MGRQKFRWRPCFHLGECETRRTREPPARVLDFGAGNRRPCDSRRMDVPLSDQTAAPLIIVSATRDPVEVINGVLRRAGHAAHCTWIPALRDLGDAITQLSPELILHYEPRRGPGGGGPGPRPGGRLIATHRRRRFGERGAHRRCNDQGCARRRLLQPRAPAGGHVPGAARRTAWSGRWRARCTAAPDARSQLARSAAFQ